MRTSHKISTFWIKYLSKLLLIYWLIAEMTHQISKQKKVCVQKLHAFFNERNAFRLISSEGEAKGVCGTPEESTH